MSKNRYVNTHFWDDTYVVSLDPTEKLLFLYFLTNPLTNIAGAYEINLRRVAFDTGIDQEMVKKVLARFTESNKIIYQDGWVLILNFIKNQSTNPKVIKGIEDAVKCCPDWVKDRLSIAYDSLSHLNTNLNTNRNTNTNAENVRAEIVQDAEEVKFTEKVISEIKKRLRITFTLPDEPVWLNLAEWAYMNNFTVEEVMRCYDHLKSQDWRTGRLSADTVKKNLPEFLLEQENSSVVVEYVMPFTGRPLK